MLSGYGGAPTNAYLPRSAPQTSLLLLLTMLPAMVLGVTALILCALQVPIVMRRIHAPSLV